MEYKNRGDSQKKTDIPGPDVALSLEASTPSHKLFWTRGATLYPDLYIYKTFLWGSIDGGGHVLTDRQT